MRIAAAAVRSINKDFSTNIARIEELLIEAKSQNASYLMLGESVLNGFDGLSWEYSIDINDNAVEFTGNIIGKLTKLCQSYQIGLGFGCYENINGFICSSYLLLNQNGVLETRYERISSGWKPSDKDSRYKNGSSYRIIKLGNSRCLIAVCGDLWTPEFIEQIGKLEFDTILWPLYIDYSINEWETSAKLEYCEQIKKIGRKTILINSINEQKDGANGGILEISGNGEIIQEVKMGSYDLMCFQV